MVRQGFRQFASEKKLRIVEALTTRNATSGSPATLSDGQAFDEGLGGGIATPPRSKVVRYVLSIVTPN